MVTCSSRSSQCIHAVGVDVINIRTDEIRKKIAHYSTSHTGQPVGESRILVILTPAKISAGMRDRVLAILAIIRVIHSNDSHTGQNGRQV